MMKTAEMLCLIYSSYDTYINYDDIITAYPSDQLSSRCVVPYYELPRYLTTYSAPIVALLAPTYVGAKPVAPTATLSSTTISLNQIPDKLIIYIRKKNMD